MRELSERTSAHTKGLDLMSRAFYGGRQSSAFPHCNCGKFLYCSFVSLITKLTRALHEETNWNIKCCLDKPVKRNSENEYQEMIYLIKSAP